MKVLILTGMANSGGTERATVNLCDALRSKKISTILFSDNGPYVENIKKMGVDYAEGDIHIKSNFLGAGKTIFKLAKILKEKEVDLIHAQMAFPTLLGILSVFVAGRSSKTRVLWHSRGLYPQTYKKVCFLFERFNVYALGNCKQEEEKLIAHGMDKKRVNYIYNNFSDDFFNQADDSMTRESYGIKESDIVLGSVSRLEKERNVDIFLKICAELYQNNKNLKFVICGGGREEDNLKNLAKELGITKNTIFLGQVTSMRSSYRLMDILINPINPSKGMGAGVGNNIVEAFFCKVLVVANDAVAISEIVIDNETGYLVDVNKEKETVLKLKKILEDFSKNSEIQDNAYKFANDMFSTKEYAEKIETIYTKIINGEPINE